MKRFSLALLATLSIAACGPSDEEIEDAKVRTEAAVSAADRVKKVLQVIGLLPTYTCGEPRSTFVGKAVEGARKDFACATVTTTSETDADLVTMDFGEGCDIRDARLSGKVVYRYSGGEDRFTMGADLSALKIDGAGVTANGGYGTCGDEKRFFAAVEGAVPKVEGASFKIDSTVGMRDGLPIIGSKELVLSGPGEVTRAEGTDKLTFEALHYEVGNYLPKEGALTIETSSGHKLRAKFEEVLWRLGKAEITIDEYDPVSVPVVR